MDRHFLEVLLQKLKVGDLRSNYLNAEPGRRLSRIDFASLRLAEDEVPVKIINGLLDNTDFKITFDLRIPNINKLSEQEQKQHLTLLKKLKNLQFDYNEAFAEHGLKPLALGYPILVKRSSQDTDKIIRAPIFIWKVELSKVKDSNNVWTFKRTDEPIKFNEVLFSFIQRDQEVDLSNWIEKLEEKPISSYQDIIDYSDKLVERISGITLNSNPLHSHLPIVEPFPSSDQINATLHEPWISWSGMLSLYILPKQHIDGEIAEVLKNFDEYKFDDFPVGKYQETNHASNATDPSQQEIINSIEKSHRQLVQGAPGTGKSQSLTAIITNALINNARTLVVCEKRTALTVIRKNLKALGLDELVVMIDDAEKDRSWVVESVRARLGNEHSIPSNVELNRKLHECDVDVRSINGYHNELGKSIFQDQNWTGLLGRYLGSEQVVSVEVLKHLLNESDFVFDENEYSEISSALSVAENKYNNAKKAASTFDTVTDQYFNGESANRSKHSLELAITSSMEKLAYVVSSISTFEYEYKHSLTTYYDNLFTNCRISLATVKSNIEEYQNSLGVNAKLNHKLTNYKITFLSAFSNKYKRANVLRKSIPDNLNEIATQLRYDRPDSQSITTDRLIKAESLREKIKEQIKNVDYWVENIANEVQERFNLLQHNEIHAKNEKYSGVLERLLIACNDTHDFIKGQNVLHRDMNQLGSFFDWKVEYDLLSHAMSEVEQSLDAYFDYFDWRVFRGTLQSPRVKKVVDAMIRSDCNNWLTGFNSWFFFWLLSQNEERFNLDIDKKITSLDENLTELQVEISNQILKNWRYKQSQKVIERNSIPKITSLYNLRGGTGQRRNSLRKIVHSDFDLFSTFFPVLLISPSACSSILPLQEGLYDLVIFDEASQLRLEHVFTQLIRGQKKIVSGDRHQMPPSSYFESFATLDDDDGNDEDFNEEQSNGLTHDQSTDLALSESLLVFAENAGYEKRYLEVHYRSRHPYLIDFSNSAFYGRRLLPMPAREDEVPIHFIEVNGEYEAHTNEKEAIVVIELLLNIVDDYQEMPSVGVATLNLFQRNLILEKMDEISNERDRAKLDKLFKAGLFVKNLENIQGIESDIIILSTTFGVRRDGSFTQNFGVLNRPVGYRLLNVLITRAKSSIYVCTSIPRTYSLRYKEELYAFKNTRKGILYAYLEYARSVSDNDNERRQQILDLLYENSTDGHKEPQNIQLTESPFEEEVVRMLSNRIDSNRIILQYKCGGFRIDIAIKSLINDRPVIAIECDGADFHSSEEAYRWDIFRQHELEKYGFHFHRIWSKNFWRYPERELNKVVAFVEKIDKSEEKQGKIG